MISKEDIRRWSGKDVFDPAGEKIGSIEDFYLDKETFEPDWVIVKRGFLGGSSKLIPYMAIEWREDHVVACFDKEMVDDSPGPGMDGRLSDEEEFDLMEHYDLMRSERTGRMVGTMGHPSESMSPQFAAGDTIEAADTYVDQRAAMPPADTYEDRAAATPSADRRRMEQQAAAAHPFSAGLEDEDHPEDLEHPEDRAQFDERARAEVAASHPLSAGLEDEEDERAAQEELQGEQVAGSTRLVRVKKFMVTERVEQVPLSEEEFEEGDESDSRRAA